jgi:hypothetical protein
VEVFKSILEAKYAQQNLPFFFIQKQNCRKIGRLLKAGILQQFRVKRTVTNNGPGFRHANILSFKKKIVNTSSRNPSPRGFIEKEGNIVKLIILKNPQHFKK